MRSLALFRNIWKLDVAELTAVDWRRSKLVIMTERHEESLQSVPFHADRPGGAGRIIANTNSSIIRAGRIVRKYECPARTTVFG
jgi:hypothetical protein